MSSFTLPSVVSGALMGAMPSEEWTDPARVDRYLQRAGDFPRRAEGESVLLEHVPREVRRVQDLGTGDGRLLAMLQADRGERLGSALISRRSCSVPLASASPAISASS